MEQREQGAEAGVTVEKRRSDYNRPVIRTMSRDEVLAAVTKGAKFPQRTSSA